MLNDTKGRLVLGIMSAGAALLLVGVVVYLFGYFQVVSADEAYRAYGKLLKLVIGQYTMILGSACIILPSPYVIYRIVKFKRQQ